MSDSPTSENCRPELFCVEIRTTHWDRLLAWYRDVLGLRSLLRVDDDRYALLAAGTARLAILGRDELPATSDRLRLVWEVAAIKPVVERLEAAGTPVSEVRTHAEGFHEVTTTDPDGNQVRLIAWPDSPPNIAATNKGTQP